MVNGHINEGKEHWLFFVFYHLDYKMCTLIPRGSYLSYSFCIFT